MRKKTALMILIILGFGLIGTSLSTLYTQNEFNRDIKATTRNDTFKVSHGFPVGWYGYTQTSIWYLFHWTPPSISPKIYWFSPESLLLDAAFWLAISFFVCVATMKSVNILHKRRASKNLSVIDI
jgi:hypothetical protein